MRKTTDSLSAVPTGSWRLNADSARIELSTHVLGTAVRVVFNEVSGLVDIRSNPLDSSVSLSIQASSLSSGNRRRDNHLRSSLGLDVRRFPIISFDGSAVTVADSQTLVVEGELAVRGRHLQVTLPVSVRSVDDCRTDLLARTEITPSSLGLRLPLPFGSQLLGSDPLLLTVSNRDQKLSALSSVRLEPSCAPQMSTGLAAGLRSVPNGMSIFRLCYLGAAGITVALAEHVG